MVDSVDEMIPRPRSPFAELFLAAQTAAPDDTATVTVRSLPFVGIVAVRGKPDDAAFLEAARGVLGLALPLTAGGVAEVEHYRVLWLGPDHWLAVCNEGEAPALTERLQDAFAGLFAAAINVSGARSRLRISGEAAADLLATGCRLDLDPAVFGPGQCLQTPLGNVTAIIHCADLEPPTYDVYVPRSTAMSFWKWLEHAGREFGLRSVAAG